MRKRTKVVDEFLKGDEPLDEEEQAEIVAVMKAEVILQQKQWCAIYAALSVVLAAAYAYLGFSQLRSPGGMRHHAAFAGTLPSWAIAAGELASGACIALSGFALVSTFHPSVKAERWIQPARAWISMAPLWLGLGIGIFWTHALMGSAKVSSIEARNWWRYMWLPLAPLLFAILGRYVMRLLEESRTGVQRLQADMYSYKKL